MPDLAWRKSSYSGTGNCIEVARSKNLVLIRDTDPCGDGLLVVTPDDWEAFVAGVKNGEFDE